MELRGNGADRKFALTRLAGFSLFDSSLTTHPVLLFSDTDFTLVRRVISGYPLSQPFASSGESKGRPFPHGRSSGQFHYVHPADDRTSMSEKNSWIHGAFEWDRRMRAKVIAADNCAFLALNADSYISIL